MDLFRRHVTLLGLALGALLAGGCDVQDAADEVSAPTFAEVIPAPSFEVDLPGVTPGAVVGAPGGYLAGELGALSRSVAWDLLWGDPALRGHLKGYRDRADQLRHAVNTIWARYPDRVVGLFWGDAAQAAWPLAEAVGLRTTLHVDSLGFGAVALPLRFQAPGLSPAPAAPGGLILGVVLAPDVPPTLGQVEAAVWTATDASERRLPAWSWGGLQRLTDPGTGLDLVLCDIGLGAAMRARLAWQGAALDMDDPHALLDEAPSERDADVRASWKYSLQDGMLRAWRRGELTWETAVTGGVLAGLDGDEESLVVIGASSVEVLDADTGVLAARFVRGWEDVPGLAQALAGLDPDRRDRDASTALPLAEILATEWALEADTAAARGWAPVAAWWDGWGTYFGSLPY